MKKENGYFIISLDFELLWGVFDKVDWREKKEYFQNTRKLVPKILHLFQNYDIGCTWATIGMLFNENWDEWNSNIPEILPEYQDSNLSAYLYGKSIQTKESEKLCFAPDLIKLIKEVPKQEIGTHTYSHYYCLEPGQTIDSFEVDLLKSIELATKFDIDLNSLVFPRNQFNPQYLDLCREMGILNVRTNPNIWYWKNTQSNSLSQKIFRTGDAYMGLNNKSYQYSGIDNNIFEQKASRLLRPHSKMGLMNTLKMRRITNEITKAAKNAEIYHLWWHPHNFAQNPEENLKELQIILEHFNECRLKYNMTSLNMQMLSKFKNFNNLV